MSCRMFIFLCLLVVLSMAFAACAKTTAPPIGEVQAPATTPAIQPSTHTQVITPTFTPMPGIGSTQISGKDGMVMVFVPAGEFIMGSDNGDISEQPAHTVYLDSYWIDHTEVTNAMYSKCVNVGICQPPSKTNSYTYSKYYTNPERPDYFGNPEFDDYPVTYVEWDEARTYCEWAERRLPTEAEWEKAARGTDGRAYPWGDDFNGSSLSFCDTNCPFSWADKKWDDGYVETSPVGSYEGGKSPYGVYDMAGNVWEWVSDWYGETYYQSSPSSNPLGPDSGLFRVWRGGSWEDNEDFTQSTFRQRYHYTHHAVGFRCACDTSP